MSDIAHAEPDELLDAFTTLPVERQRVLLALDDMLSGLTQPTRGPQRVLQPCGTWAAFKRHKKAGEEPCFACVTAARLRESRRRRRKAEQVQAPVGAIRRAKSVRQLKIQHKSAAERPTAAYVVTDADDLEAVVRLTPSRADCWRCAACQTRSSTSACEHIAAVVLHLVEDHLGPSRKEKA